MRKPFELNVKTMRQLLPLLALFTTILHLCNDCYCVSTHNSNWAVLVDTSKFWFNYRHYANALSMYRTVKRLGIPDSQIILMLAEDIACHDNNPIRAEVFNNKKKELELYGNNIEVDYRGNDVNVESFLRVLLGRHLPGTPASKRLDSNEDSNVFVYLSGHGGNEFMKFLDAEEITAQDIGSAMKQMHAKGRFNKLFFVVDTCQATTLFNTVDTDGVVTSGSSIKDENAYSHHHDSVLGTAVIDRFTYHFLEFMELKGASATLDDINKHMTYERLLSNHRIDGSRLQQPMSEVLVTDFLGSVLQIVSHPWDPQQQDFTENDISEPEYIHGGFLWENDEPYESETRFYF